MIRTLLAASLLAFSLNSQAGFITGVIVGSALSSGSSSKTQENSAPLMITSDTHDTLMCEKISRSNKCRVEPYKIYNTRREWIDNSDEMTPSQYAYSQGYKVLHKIGNVLYNSNEYLILEVSK